MSTTQEDTPIEAGSAPQDLSPSDQLIRRLLTVVASAGALANVVLITLRLLTPGPRGLTIWLNVGFLVTSLAVLGLVRRGRPRSAAHVLLWGGWGLNTAFLWLHGGVQNINWTTFMVLISGASWMLGQRSTLAMTALTGGLFILASWADGRGWIGAPVRDSAVIVTFYFCIMFGLTAAMGLAARHSYRLRIERERRTSVALSAREVELRKLSQVIEQSPESIVIADLLGRIEYANPTALARLQLDAAQVLGQDARHLVKTQLPEVVRNEMQRALTAGQDWIGKLYSRQADGSERVEAARVTPLRQPDGQVTHHVWLRHDITAHHEAEARLHHLARHDALTDLPNRTLLHERLTELLGQARQSQQHMALLQLNIDRFKTINEARGQAAGDALLCAFGERLRSLARGDELVARLGADEFAVLLPGLDRDAATAGHQAYAFACRIQEALRTALQLRASADHLTVTASIGIALCPVAETDSAADAQRRAATALNQAKTLGGARTAFFEATMGEAAEQRFRIERDLREALADHQLRLFLQPQVDAQGRWTGAEVLLRWQHPTLGLVSPGVFIPIAEESDLIVDVGRWVFTEAVRLIEREARAGHALPLSVNLSPRQFRQPDFVAWIQQLLVDHDIDASLLTLEVTEGLVIGDIDEAIARMQALRALGLHFSIDDFGTGYSSLAYLKRLPISELKIDRSFVQDAPRHADDAALVETILSVARHMRLKVVAEGVEEPAQARFLAERAQGVILQGYLYGRPAPAEQWLRRWHAAGALPAYADPRARMRTEPTGLGAFVD